MRASLALYAYVMSGPQWVVDARLRLLERELPVGAWEEYLADFAALEAERGRIADATSTG